MFPHPHPPARTLADWVYFCFVNKWHDFSKAAEFVSRRSQNTGLQNSGKGSFYRRDVGFRKAPAHRDGPQAGGVLVLLLSLLP